MGTDKHHITNIKRYWEFGGGMAEGPTLAKASVN